jgi:stage V sporulation protein AD
LIKPLIEYLPDKKQCLRISYGVAGPARNDGNRAPLTARFLEALNYEPFGDDKMKTIYTFQNPPTIAAAASVVGKKENEGPLGGSFDYVDESDTFGAPTWEQSESEAQRLALGFALNKRGITQEDVDLLFAGDLMNQCTGSSYGLLTYKIPFFGLYGACSTSAEGLCLAAMSTGAGLCERAAVVTSSHFCSAERQFRTPLEYGGQRPPTAQWTVTGAGAFIVEAAGKSGKSPNNAHIQDVMPGRIIDAGVTDLSNMGAAMTPAVIDSLTRYFKETGTKPSDYDAIFTGDLGYEGSAILIELMRGEGYDLSKTHKDCGMIIYEREAQDVHAGGSGCGCGASVLASHILPKMQRGELRNILYIATGALMSTASVGQKLSIPAIGHVVHLISDK